MRYCHVIDSINIDGVIVKKIDQGPCDLPENYKNITNFYLLSLQELKQHGWLPIITKSEKKPVFVSSTFEIQEDAIIEHLTTRDYTNEERILQQKESNIKAWQDIREKRNFLLKQSDLHVLADLWEQLTVEEKQKISKYRQALRDLPTQYDSPEKVVFPTL